MKEESKIILITGSPNSGKTFFANKLALELSKDKKNSVIISTDIYTPILPMFLSEEKDVVSLRELLCKKITLEEVLKALVPLNDNSYVYTLGSKLGENFDSFIKISENKFLALIDVLKSISPFIIIDTSNICSDEIFNYSVGIADYNFSLYDLSDKSLINFHSNFKEMRKKIDCIAKLILTKTNTTAGVKDYFSESIDYNLPLLEELKKTDNPYTYVLSKKKWTKKYDSEVKRISESLISNR